MRALDEDTRGLLLLFSPLGQDSSSVMPGIIAFFLIFCESFALCTNSRDLTQFWHQKLNLVLTKTHVYIYSSYLIYFN